MDFRIIVLCLACWISPVYAGTLEQLDQLNTLVFQYPSQALSEINTLEGHFEGVVRSDSILMRLSALKCESYIQLGENAAAVNLARLSEARAKQSGLEQARPYFLNCMAQAYANVGDYQQALPLLYSSISLSRQLKQPQALISGLWLRSLLNANVNHNSAAIEDLRLALDIYPDMTQQKQKWTWPPKGYLYTSMAKQLAEIGEQKEAEKNLKKALNEETTQGKVLLFIALDMARFAQQNQQPNLRNKYTQIARVKLAELGTPLELAIAYKTIALIDFDSGKYSSAEQLLNLSLSTFRKEADVINTISVLWLNAQVKLKRHNEAAGLTLMEQAISLAKDNARYSDLKNCYATLATYFAEQGKFSLAYQYQLKQLDALENETLSIKHIWLSQLKADLSRKEQITPPTHSLITATTSNGIMFSSFFPIALVIVSLVIFITWYQRKLPQQKQTEHLIVNLDTKMDKKQSLEALLNINKQAGYPLSLLVFNPKHIIAADVPIVIEQLQTKLREQDVLLQQSDQQIIIVLPHTSEQGAMNVIKQLSSTISVWQEESKVNIGLASMQQFDDLHSMIKRANINQLRKLKTS
ncbi:histidine kinase [Shewanella gelidimarina]|uniref:histidine kinase n=1 Tax=Shewanella gelidimarina TaxID=56813 RepID=UPI002010185D|nr:histidine kinase [Shewanella gelidimarina]MCL1059762.1 histidine kinase [Shewanella gelidimarina]